MATIGSCSSGSRRLSGQTASFVTVTFSNSYTTGGESLAAKDLTGNPTNARVDAVIPTIRSASAGAVANVAFDYAASKLKAFTATGEVANGTNLSGVTVDLLVFGR